MKKFKKVLICAAACVTACSFTALAACTDNGPGDGLSTDVKVATAMSSEALETQIAKFENSSATSFSVNGGLKITKQGELPADMTVATVSAKVNLGEGNADALVSLNGLIFGGGEEGGENKVSPAADTAEGGEGDAMMPISVYLRNWKAFYPNFDGVGEGAYNYMDLAADASEGAGLTTGDIVTMIGSGFMQDNTMLLTLANSTKSIVVDETAHTITLDINKMVYGVYDYIKQIANNLTENTTVSGLMKCSAVKYYLDAYLGGMTGEELFETVMGVIAGGSVGGGSGEGGMVPFSAAADENPYAAVMPEEGEKAYDYIMRMLNSQDFATMVGSETPIGAKKIGELIGEDAAAALKSVKDAVNLIGDSKIITATALTVPSTGGMDPALAGASVSGMKLVYAFDAQNVLQSVELSGKVGMTMNETAVEMDLSLEVEFSAEAITDFEDIGAFTVNVYDETSGTTSVKTVTEILTPPSEA